MRPTSASRLMEPRFPTRTRNPRYHRNRDEPEEMKMRTIIFAIVGSLLAALPGAAQYGGRPGDTVLYVLTSKGSGAIQPLPRSTVNTASGLQTIDPTTVTPQDFPPAFPGET